MKYDVNGLLGPDALSRFFSLLALFFLMFYFIFPGYYKVYHYSLSLASLIIFIFSFSDIDKKTIIPVLSLFVFILLADFYNLIFGLSALSDFEKIFRNVVLIFPFLLFVSKSTITALNIVLAGTGLIVITLVFMIFQKYGMYAQESSHYNQVYPGLWFNKGSFSTAIILFFALFVGVSLQLKENKAKWFLLILVIAMIAILYLTQARGPFLAFVYILVFVIFHTALATEALKNHALLLLLLGSFFILGVGYFIAGGRIILAWQQLIEHYSHGSEATSVSIRIDTWKLAWDVFLQRPLTGVGAQNINIIRESVAAMGEYPAYILKYHTHSEYFLTLERGGVVGLFGLFWMLFYPFISLKKFGVQFKYMMPLFLVVGSFMIIGITSATIRNNIGANSFIFCLLFAYYISYKFYRRELP